ncbi:hypothetical protein GBAR_LOCUS28514 [Geodia barretti]|uniref:Uncharacterized protein n=1 Tax=Geodia barretti TaxID=519541 RepID=A0AA35TQV1_GEOBA|nr:hypothetical protein GBAR_LOCUS28514 [Geodia barretti]
MSATTEEAAPPNTHSRRERAFLGQLPSDFLRVEPASTAAHPSSSGDQPHLAPMSFGRPAAHQRPHEAMLGRLKVTIAQVHYSILPSPSLPISPSLYLTSSLRLSLLFLPLPLSPFPHTLHVAHSVVCKSTTNQLSRN